MEDFYVYILKCRDGSYYTGHTDNLEKRMSEHQEGLVPCYTSTRRPVYLVYADTYASRAEAVEAERRIKPWSRKKKEVFH